MQRRVSPLNSVKGGVVPMCAVETSGGGGDGSDHSDADAAVMTPKGGNGRGSRLRLSFRTTISMLLAVFIILACVLVWYLGFSNLAKTIDDSTALHRKSILAIVAASVEANLQLPVKAIGSLTALLKVRFTINDFRTRANLSETTGFLQDTDFVFNQLGFSYVEGMGYGTQAGFYAHRQILIANKDSFTTDNFTMGFAWSEPDGHGLGTVYDFNLTSTPLNPLTPSSTPAAIMPKKQMMQTLGPSYNAIPGYTPLTRPWYKAGVAANGAIGWTAPFNLLSVLSETTVVATVQGIVDPANQEVVAVTWAFCYLNHVTQLISTLDVGPNGVIVLFDTTGMMLSSSSPAHVGLSGQVRVQDSSDTMLQSIAELFAASGSGVPKLTNTSLLYLSQLPTNIPFIVNGHHYHLSSTPVIVPGVTWVLTVLTLDSDWTGTVGATNRNTALIGVAILVGALIISWFVTFAMVLPMKAMIVFMKEFGVMSLAAGGINEDGSETNNPNDTKPPPDFEHLYRMWKYAMGDAHFAEPKKTNRVTSGSTSTFNYPLNTTMVNGRKFPTSLLRKSMSSLFCLQFMEEIFLMKEAFGRMLLEAKNAHYQLNYQKHAKRQFIRYVFHEVRVPLNALTLATEQVACLIKEQADKIERQQALHLIDSNTAEAESEWLTEAIDMMNIQKEQGVVMSRILNDVLTFQKIEDGALALEMNVFDIRELVHATVHTFSAQFQSAGVEVQVECRGFERLKERLAQAVVMDETESNQVSPIALSRTIPRTANSNGVAVNIADSNETQPAASETLSPRQSPPTTVESIQMDASNTNHTGNRIRPSSKLLAVGDRLRIRQLLSNFISNAIKFTRAGGRVTVLLDVEFVSKAPKIAQYTSFNGAGNTSPLPPASPSAPNSPVKSMPPPAGRAVFKLSVTDTGQGMSIEQVNRLFKTYSMSSSEISDIVKLNSSGLGLSICKRLSDLFGGEIGCSSVPNCGSTFFVTLPLDLQNVPVQPPSSSLSLGGGRTTSAPSLNQIQQHSDSPNGVVNDGSSSRSSKSAHGSKNINIARFHRQDSMQSTDYIEYHGWNTQLTDAPLKRSPTIPHGSSYSSGPVRVAFSEEHPVVPPAAFLPEFLSDHSSSEPRSSAIDDLFVHPSSVVDPPRKPSDSVSPPTINVGNSPSGESRTRTLNITSPTNAITSPISTSAVFFHAATDVQSPSNTNLLSPSAGTNLLSPSVGTPFNFSSASPDCPSAHASASPTATSSPQLPLTRRLLVVEDSAPNRKLLILTLKSLGWDVEGVPDGRDAIQFFQRIKDAEDQAARNNLPPPSGNAAPTRENVAAVFMDNFMEFVSGVDATRAIRAMGFTLPILGVTGSAMDEDCEEFIQAGASTILTKPIGGVKQLEATLKSFGLTTNKSKRATKSKLREIEVEDRLKNSKDKPV